MWTAFLRMVGFVAQEEPIIVQHLGTIATTLEALMATAQAITDAANAVAKAAADVSAYVGTLQKNDVNGADLDAPLQTLQGVANTLNALIPPPPPPAQ